MKSCPQPCHSCSSHRSQPPSPAGEANGSHPGGEVTKTPPSAFHPRQREKACSLGRGPQTQGKGRVVGNTLMDSEQGGEVWERSQGKLLTTSCFPHGTRNDGTQHIGFPQSLGTTALGTDLPRGVPALTGTSFLKHGPAVRAPKSSGGRGELIFVLYCLTMSLFPQGCCVQSGEVVETRE